MYLSGNQTNSFDYHRTNPVVVSQGNLYLDKPANVYATGSVIVDGGSLYALRNNQIAYNAYVILQSGYLSLQNQLLDSMRFGNGSWNCNLNGTVELTGNHAYSVGGGPQSLVFETGVNFNGTSFKFSAPGGTSSGGGVAFYGNSTFTNTQFNLGGHQRYWYVADNAWVTLNGNASVYNGGLYKYGGGWLELGGTSANANSLDTIVENGGLYLNKSPGVNAIGGNLYIYGGTVSAGNTQQLPDNAHVYVYPTANLFLNNETLGSLYFEGDSWALARASPSPASVR